MLCFSQTKLVECTSSGVSFSYPRAEQLLHHLSLLYMDVLALPRLTSKAVASASESSVPTASSVEKLVSAVQAMVLHAIDTAGLCKPQLPSSSASPLSPLSSQGSHGSDSELSETSTIASSASATSVHSTEGEDPAHVQALSDFLPSVEAAAKDVARAAKSLSNALKRMLRSSTSQPGTKTTATASPTLESNRKSTGLSSVAELKSPTGSDSPQHSARQRRQLPSLDNVLKDQAQTDGSPGTQSKQRTSLGAHNDSNSPGAATKQRASVGVERAPTKRRLPRSPSASALDTAKSQDSSIVEQEV